MEVLLAHLHPLLVHLPIGILILAVVFAWIARIERHKTLMAALPIMLRLGAAAALISCLSGGLLSRNGGYDPQTLWLHQWLGIATSVVAVLGCWFPKNLTVITFAAGLLLATGHFGGTMTHGDGYLSAALLNNGANKARPADEQEALVYPEIIATILEEKCNSCHGKTKQKAGLRLDQPNLILKGGESGVIILPNDSENGELMRRCLLPLGHEDHMPPKEKPQLTTAEIEILRWWLAQGADFQKKTKELPQTEQIRKALLDWKSHSNSSVSLPPDVPLEHIAPAPEQMLEKLRQSGVIVLPVERESHWLSVDFVNLPNPPDAVFAYLESISKQIVWLNMNGCSATEKNWGTLGKMTNLIRLSLGHSSISDTVFLYIKNMERLQSLNLASTKITPDGLQQIAGLKDLKTVYLYQTAIPTNEWRVIQAVFPNTNLDTGGYVLPFMDSDTARLKAPVDY